MTTTPSLQTWRILIHFDETEVVYLAHTPTEIQQRGYHNNKLYNRDWWSNDIHHLVLFTDAVTPDEAKAKAKQLLLEYVQVSA